MKEAGLLNDFSVATGKGFAIAAPWMSVVKGSQRGDACPLLEDLELAHHFLHCCSYQLHQL